MPYTSQDFEPVGVAEGLNLIQCINCGATAPTREKIQHFPNCKPGEFEKWRKYYEEEP